MIQSLRLQRFRACDDLALQGLSRINLLVGANSAGKTSVLAGAEVLLAGGQPWVMLRSPTRRADGFLPQVDRPAGPPQVDLRHLFHGHRLAPGSSFRLEADDGGKRWVECEVVSSGAPAQLLLDVGADSNQGLEGEAPLALRVRTESSGPEGEMMIHLLAGGGFPTTVRGRFREQDPERPVNLIRDPGSRREIRECATQRAVAAGPMPAAVG
jgi:hypothetical protein